MGELNLIIRGLERNCIKIWPGPFSPFCQIAFFLRIKTLSIFGSKKNWPSIEIALSCDFSSRLDCLFVCTGLCYCTGLTKYIWPSPLAHGPSPWPRVANPKAQIRDHHIPLANQRWQHLLRVSNPGPFSSEPSAITSQPRRFGVLIHP